MTAAVEYLCIVAVVAALALVLAGAVVPVLEPAARGLHEVVEAVTR